LSKHGKGVKLPAGVKFRGGLLMNEYNFNSTGQMSENNNDILQFSPRQFD
jgi:hypothetical protein